jgi:biotin transport system substrate-specific component
MTTSEATLAGRIWPAESAHQALRLPVLAVLGSLFVALCAQISIPMIPVPMTMQTFAVLAIGTAYGSRLGAATLLLYAMEGAAGLPVFANFQSGLFLPAGEILATGGYIIGFILAAGLVGWLAERGWDRSIVKLFGATLLGAALVYVPGLIWLAVWLATLKGMAGGAAIAAAISSGFVPFIIGDVLKAALSAAGVSAMGQLLRKD